MKWVQMPTDFGWWFFTPDKKYWDLAKPVYVSKVESGSEPSRFEARINPKWEKDAKISSLDGWWYGPVKIPRA